MLTRLGGNIYNELIQGSDDHNEDEEEEDEDLFVVQRATLWTRMIFNFFL